MKKLLFAGFLTSALLGCPSIDWAQEYRSKYVDEEYREIKSLSSADVDELLNGKGWGLARAAELNGTPGPLHLLEMKGEIKLSETQVSQIEHVYADIKQQAILLGTDYVELERKLNASFAARALDEDTLKNLLHQISAIRMQLRFVHLSAHLKMLGILTAAQIKNYNRLRGYSTQLDPCQNIPAGHDAAMWRRHNGCK